MIIGPSYVFALSAFSSQKIVFSRLAAQFRCVNCRRKPHFAPAMHTLPEGSQAVRSG
jgi:hypothetical protein